MTEYSYEVDGSDVPYFVAVPDGYDGATRSQLQILLPGAAGKAEPAALGWGPSLLEHDAVVAILDVGGRGRNPEVVQGLIEDLVEDYCVDPQRVGVIGSSSSASFAGRSAAESGEHIASMVVGIGGSTPPDDVERPVPLLAWTGGTDKHMVDPSVEAWAEVNGCDAEPTVTTTGDDLTTFTYENCDAPVEYHVVDGMGHQVPSHQCFGSVYCHETQSLDLLKAAAEFFAANPLDR